MRPGAVARDRSSSLPMVCHGFAEGDSVRRYAARAKRIRQAVTLDASASAQGEDRLADTEDALDAAGATPRRPTLDGPVFAISLACVVAAAVPMILFPDAAGKLVDAVYAWLASTLGIFYHWATIAATVFLAWLAFSRHGKRVLGDTAQPEYSSISWMGMLFCAGIGSGMLYWSGAEWASYMDQPPFGVAPGSAEAREWAATYGIFHWGISAWALYCLPTVAIAWPYYRYRLPYLRLSGALTGLFGTDFAQRPWGRVVDLFFIIALIGGTGTSLGLATPMLGAVAARLIGIDESFAMTLVISALCVALFAISVYLGLERGIRRLSNLNLALAGVFLVWVLVTGPAIFALELGTSAIGLMLQEFVRMNTWTDPILQTGFTEDWTVFYWAWWIAYGPFMGLFVTKISRGRTLRAVIFGMIAFGTLGCALFYVVWGNSVMWMDMHQGIGFLDLVREGKTASAIAAAVGNLAGQPLPLAIFLVLGLVFVATTYDSASYSIAASATRNMTPGSHPTRPHRVFWAFALAVLPIALVLIDTLSAAKSATLVASLPLLGVGVLMVVSLMRSLREADHHG